MANWSAFTLTDKGLALQAKVNAGSTELKFTKFVIGSGVPSGTINSMTELAHKEMDVPINQISVEKNTVTMSGVITNTDVSVGFTLQEFGLNATDPDEGEILYGVMTDPNPDFIPAEGTATVVSQEFELHLTVSNTGNVSAVLDPTALVTKAMLDAHDANESAHQKAFEKHNKDESAHPFLLKKITTDISTHNTSNTAHQDIRQKITDLGNPVVNVEEKGGVVNVTKSNGDKNQFYSGLNILQRNKKYEVGDIAYSPNLKSYQYLECITAGTTGDTEPDFSAVTTGGVINDGTLRFILRTIKDTAMTGDIAFRPYVAPGWVKAVGDTVNRADYPTLTKFADDYDLWTDTPAEEPWKFGNGDGSTTMMLPDYRERIIQGGDTVEAREAGLPDIQGSIIASREGATGAFKNTTPNKNSALGYDTHYVDMNTNNFKASRYNSIYGASTTVQPPTIVLIPQIKI